MTQDAELRAAKRKAMAFLLVAAAVFIATLFMPHGFATEWVRAAAEAAMVGGMADWFAVAALFHRIPVPGLARHTNIIIRKRDDIADGLAVFVKEKFLDRDSLVTLIDKHDPAAALTHWLDSAANTRRLGDAVARFARGTLELLDEKSIQAFAKRAIDAMIDRVDLSQSAAEILDSLTRDNRHQALLKDAIGHLVELLRKPATRELIAGRIVEWLKTEHPRKEKVLPTEWIGSNGAEMISDALGRILEHVEQDDSHELRGKFDEVVRGLIGRLKNDASFHAKAEDIKRYLKQHPAFNAYIGELWAEWRERLKADLAREDSAIYQRVVAAGQWIGAELARNEALRQSLNQHLRDAARSMAPDFADFITRHISSTVRSWDAREMSRQIELNVGKDLQYIRMNGTVVGGLIGAGLYLLAQLPALL
ncbi:DUF445 domain-containing protein [Cupriavidus respiraculi]|uniref:DUF445 domain-containing protein n=1 Tax=Cupriavidus respiraculi TaxID=195930 RepID=A0ABM8XHM1_9BURK|nr:DUF445 family protein [Cupriavidus respiraculi]CAG9179501.1 hypothetical protein LMG21510_03796 [Cupriavidus respiraculi]